MKTVAVVEDNADNRMLLRAILEDDYELSEYRTGHEALVGMKGAPPDLVLLDISLPEMDGIEVLTRFRADGSKSCPVIALTAHAMAGDRERLLRAGFDDYLSKPILDESILRQAIERLIGRTG